MSNPAQVKPDNFTFDPESHTYRLDGVILPSVTQVLDVAGLVDRRFFNGTARDRGTAAHIATQFADENDLDESSIDESTAGFLAAYRKFKAERPFRSRMRPATKEGT